MFLNARGQFAESLPVTVGNKVSRYCHFCRHLPLQKVDEKVDGGVLELKKGCTTVARERKGTITERDGKLYARVRFKDESGKTRDIWRKSDNRTHARQLIRQILNEVENASATSLDAANMTFAEIARYFESQFLRPAEYVNGRKVAGVRSLTPAIAAVNALKEHFGNKKLRHITYADISAFRAARLKMPTKYGRQRAIASVNRELDKLRRIFNIAIQQGWLTENPFKRGKSLISHAEENQRERVLSREEEVRLLAAIDAEPKRAHLKSIILIALDCGLRRGEITSLVFSDLDFVRRTINVRAFNSKTARSRVVAMTNRVYANLRERFEESAQEPGQLVFGGIKSVRTSFAKACKAASVSDFRFHDCRHTAITRMIRAGLPPVEVMRVSGHSTLSCLYRYSNLDSDTVFRAAAALDAFNAKAAEAQTTTAPDLIN